jgi:hypothetical protein
MSAGPSESRMQTKALQFFRSENPRVPLLVRRLMIDRDQIGRPGDVKRVYLGFIKMIAQSA